MSPTHPSAPTSAPTPALPSLQSAAPSSDHSPSSPHTPLSPSETLNASTLPRLLDPSLAHLRDVTLIPAKSPGRTIRAHRFVLAAASPVLRASLSADPNATVLTLAHADADALDAALQFVYGRDDAVNRLPAHALWTALSTCVAYAILQPLDAVQKRIVDSVDYHNVFYHWSMAEKYNLDAVQIRCRNLVKHNFVTVSKQPEFLDICPQRLARVLRIHDLIVYTEDDVFQALERWLAFDVDARAEHALHLLRLVRLPTIPDRILLRVCRSPYFGGHNEFYQLLLEALIRRTEVRIVHAPRISAVAKRWRKEPPTPETASDYPPPLSFKPLGISDHTLLPRPSSTNSGNNNNSNSKQPSASSQTVDYNRKEDRTVLFEGLFPLRWYKSVRFRPRSPTSLLFSVVIPKWSSCRRRFISESRSFLNHKWSLWLDPFSADLSGSARDRFSESKAQRSEDPGRQGSTIDTDRTRGTSSGTTQQTVAPTASTMSPTRASHAGDDSDYISIYLCCESELGGSNAVDARVDFSLFVVSTNEEYGMERKVCVDRTFKSHGQAMGFRRHIRRNRLHSPAAGLYSRDKDELVVGAHLVAPDVVTQLPSTAFSHLSRTSVADDLRAESPLSPHSGPLEGSRMTMMETEPSPILTAVSRTTT